MVLIESLVAFFAVILILVAVHEYGHYAAARACGVRVMRFSIGFGRPLVKHVDARGTEWVLGWLPLGGYVRMLQTDDDEFSEGDESRTFNRTTAPRRIIIAIAGPLANLVLAAVALWGVLLLGSQQPYAVTGEIEPDSIAARAGLKEGLLILAVDGRDTPTPAKVGASIIRRIGDEGEIVIETGRLGRPDAPRQQYHLDISDWSADAAQTSPFETLGIGFSGKFIVGSVVAESPAMRAGIREFDRIIAVDGQPTDTVSRAIEAIAARPGESISISVDRAGEQRDILVELAHQEDGRGILGVQLGRQHVRFGPLEAVPVALAETYEYSGLLIDLIGKLFTRQVDTSGVGGPVAIATVVRDSARLGTTYFLQILALLSINLFLINLLPFPLLDGGHVLMASVEGITRRPLPARVQLVASFIGIAFIALLMGIAIYNDVAGLLQ